VIEYRYDYDGLLASRTVDGVETLFVWDRTGGAFPVLLEVRDANSDLIRRYEHDGFRYTRVHHADGSNSVLLTDHIGTVRGVANEVGFTAINYDAFGNLIRDSVSNLDIGFAGGLLDSLTGLSYYASRWYDPATARFTQVDSDPGSIADTRTFNRYVYSLGDPVNRFDPLGQRSIAESITVLGVFSGILAAVAVADPTSSVTSFLTGGRTNFLPENMSGTTRPIFEVSFSPSVGTLPSSREPRQGEGTSSVNIGASAGLSFSGGFEILNVGTPALYAYIGAGVGFSATGSGSVGTTENSNDSPVSGSVRGAVGDVFDTPTNADYEGQFVSFTAGFSFAAEIRTPIGSASISAGLVRSIAYSPAPGSEGRFSHTLTEFSGGVPFGGSGGDFQALLRANVRGGVGMSWYFEVLQF